MTGAQRLAEGLRLLQWFRALWGLSLAVAVPCAYCRSQLRTSDSHCAAEVLRMS